LQDEVGLFQAIEARIVSYRKHWESNEEIETAIDKLYLMQLVSDGNEMEYF
jgi:hypothetical protein